MHQTGMLGFYNVPKWEEGEWRYDQPGFSLPGACLLSFGGGRVCLSCITNIRLCQCNERPKLGLVGAVSYVMDFC